MRDKELQIQPITASITTSYLEFGESLSYDSTLNRRKLLTVLREAARARFVGTQPLLSCREGAYLDPCVKHCGWTDPRMSTLPLKQCSVCVFVGLMRYPHVVEPTASAAIRMRALNQDERILIEQVWFDKSGWCLNRRTKLCFAPISRL